MGNEKWLAKSKRCKTRITCRGERTSRTGGREKFWKDKNVKSSHSVALNVLRWWRSQSALRIVEDQSIISDFAFRRLYLQLCAE